MGKEIEYKFAASVQTLEQIRAALGDDVRTIRMETTYYDTADLTLAQLHWTLRLRMENGEPVCTLKTPAGGMGRNEYECRCSRIEDAIAALCRLSGSDRLQVLTAPGLIPICGARFTRQCQMMQQADMSAELALDQGILFGGGQEQPLCEVELELKSGTQAALDGCARYLQHRFHLTPEPKSKFRRALDLAEGVHKNG